MKMEVSHQRQRQETVTGKRERIVAPAKSAAGARKGFKGPQACFRSGTGSAEGGCTTAGGLEGWRAGIGGLAIKTVESIQLTQDLIE